MRYECFENTFQIEGEFGFRLTFYIHVHHCVDNGNRTKSVKSCKLIGDITSDE